MTVTLLGVDDDGYVWVSYEGQLYYIERGKALLRQNPGYTQWSDAVKNDAGRPITIDANWLNG